MRTNKETNNISEELSENETNKSTNWIDELISSSPIINEDTEEFDEKIIIAPKQESLAKTIVRTVLVTTASCLTALTIFGFASGALRSANSYNPNNQEMLNNIMFLDPKCDYMSASAGGLINSDLKYLPAKSGTNYVILDKNITTEQHKQIETFLNDLNYLFTEINSNYKFELLEDYSFLNKLNADTIVIKNTDKLSGHYAAAHSCKRTPTLNGLKTSFNRIYLNPEDDYSEKYSEGCLNIVHEFMHILGVDDNYNKSSPYFETIMGYCGTISDSYYSLNDLLVLKCKYGKINNVKEANDYITFACKYLNKNPDNYLLNARHDNFYKNTLPDADKDEMFTPNLIK